LGYKKTLIWLPLTLLITYQSFGQIPAGYYNNAFGKTGDSLRKALSIITSTGHIKLSYTPNIWNAYAYTDVRPNDNTKIWDMYSDIPNGTPPYLFTIITNQCGTGGNSEGICYAREHCMPNSWWGGIDNPGNPQYTDLHHLFPSDQYVNGKKSNNPIGITDSPLAWISLNGSKLGVCTLPGYSGTVFEPIDEYKGDFARAYFYIASRYYNKFNLWVQQITSTTTSLKALAVLDTNTNNYNTWFINMLLSWHHADTVSTKEINRNNAVYYSSGQHNRNPFVDYPEFADYIWGNIQFKPEPTNHITNFQYNSTLSNSFSTILTWTDSYGTTSPDGYIIKAQKTNSNTIQNPIDSIPEVNTALCKIVYQGNQTVTFTELSSETAYTFKIFPFTNNGLTINYKTDGNIPQISIVTPVWKEDFENGSKLAYSLGTVNCTMGNWTLDSALIGTLTNDKKIGYQSIRGSTFKVYMNFDKIGGAGNITINTARFSSDQPSYWKLQKSINSGQTWITIRDSIYTSETSLTPKTFIVNEPNNVRFKLLSYNGNQINRRTNIDEITITNYQTPYKYLKLKCFLEGLFNGLTMNSVQNENGAQWGASIADKITIELRDSIFPFPIIYSNTDVLLDIFGNATIDSIPATVNNKYYLVIKTRNHIETWSALPISFYTDTISYDFTSNASTAYGSNLKYKQLNSNKNLFQSRNQIYNDIKELKSFKYNPERFIITIFPSDKIDMYDIIVKDKLTNKIYIKKATKEYLYNKKREE
jgi:endonuclease I